MKLQVIHSTGQTTVRAFDDDNCYTSFTGFNGGLVFYGWGMLDIMACIANVLSERGESITDYTVCTINQ